MYLIPVLAKVRHLNLWIYCINFFSDFNIFQALIVFFTDFVMHFRLFSLCIGYWCNIFNANPMLDASFVLY